MMQIIICNISDVARYDLLSKQADDRRSVSKLM